MPPKVPSKEKVVVGVRAPPDEEELIDRQRAANSAAKPQAKACIRGQVVASARVVEPKPQPKAAKRVRVAGDLDEDGNVDNDPVASEEVPTDPLQAPKKQNIQKEKLLFVHREPPSFLCPRRHNLVLPRPRPLPPMKSILWDDMKNKTLYMAGGSLSNYLSLPKHCRVPGT